MSGWRRLWIVLSLLLGIPAGLIAYDAHDSTYAYVPYTAGMKNEAFWQAAYRHPVLQDCVWSTAEAMPPIGDEAMVTCSISGALDMALVWALAPGLLLGALGLTIRWIYRGFRPPAA